MKTRILTLTGIVLLAVSCGSDDPNLTVPPGNNENVIFDHYTVETTSHYANDEQRRTFTTALLQEQKFFSETTEQFINGAGQGEFTQQHYFYQNGLLVKRAYENDVRDFFYDNSGRLIGLTWNMPDDMRYYRFAYVNAGQVYFEQLSAPYTDANAAVTSRIVLEFSAQDDIVKAGPDADLDGTVDWFHSFGYDDAHNLTTIQGFDGTVIHIDYSGVRDNFAKLAVNTYGRKNLLVYQAECYAHLVLGALRHSTHLRMSDTQEALVEVQQWPYYYRMTKTLAEPYPALGVTTVTTFFFG